MLMIIHLGLYRMIYNGRNRSISPVCWRRIFVRRWFVDFPSRKSMPVWGQ